MNTKFVHSSILVGMTIMLLVVFLLTGIPAFATSSGTSGYNVPVLMNSMNFTATVQNGAVHTSWTPYAPNGFNYYKVIRSTANPDPVYPDDGYIKADSNPDASSYIDSSPKSETAYYRVCSIASPNRYCSNVVTINGSGDTSSYSKPAPDPVEPAVITLTGNVEEGFLNLEWLIEGNSPNGFKIAKSTVNENPVYPPMKGDTYKYLTSASARQLKDFNVTAGKTYHYRVCQYDGSGGCVSYSNAVALTAPDDFVSVKEEVSLDKAVAVSDTGYHQYKTAVDYLLSEKIAEGYGDGTFKPDNRINRAEFMKIVIGAKYSQDYIDVSAGGNCFSDVRTVWYAPYVCLAKEEGIVGGYPDGTFRPAQNISFVEAAKILAEVYGLQVVKGASWYEGYVNALQENNYIPSTVSTLEKTITRAEMAELIWRIKEEKKDQASSTLIQGDVVMDSGEYAGWTKYQGNGFSFYHPGWYQGMNWGRVTLTEELDFYQNFGVSGYMAIDTYMHVYEVAGSDLNTNVWFLHPFYSSQEMVINGLKALKRRYRAPRGTIVNGGRATGENENIIIYTYQLPDKVVALHYFNAHGSELRDVDTFYKIAESFRAD